MARSSFTAIYYDHTVIEDELENPHGSPDPMPMLYFKDPALRTTIVKIGDLLAAPTPPQAICAETLCLPAAIELHRVTQLQGVRGPAESGRLSSSQERLVRDFIEQNLHRDLSLDQLAGLTGLSRFHFARAFKKTVGTPPHRFVLRSRIDRATTMLLANHFSTRDIAAAVGFGSVSQFSAAFRKLTGYSPTQFRRAL